MPVSTKAGPMPADERLWADDHDDLQHRRKPSIQLNKEHAIAVRKPDAPMHHPTQHNQLVSGAAFLASSRLIRLE
jgi:hypothetical protein